MCNCSCSGPSEDFSVYSRRGLYSSRLIHSQGSPSPSPSSTNHHRDGFISAEQMSFPDAFAQTQEVQEAEQCGHAECEALVFIAVFTGVARQLG